MKIFKWPTHLHVETFFFFCEGSGGGIYLCAVSVHKCNVWHEVCVCTMYVCVWQQSTVREHLYMCVHCFMYQPVGERFEQLAEPLLVLLFLNGPTKAPDGTEQEQPLQVNLAKHLCSLHVILPHMQPQTQHNYDHNNTFVHVHR